jgi:hypothetical protein
LISKPQDNCGKRAKKSREKILALVDVNKAANFQRVCRTDAISAARVLRFCAKKLFQQVKRQIWHIEVVLGQPKKSMLSVGTKQTLPEKVPLAD